MSPLQMFRSVALAEGVSFIVLLLIAMPLKYLADLPLAVRIVGSIHGGLFIAFLLVLGRAGIARGWPLRRWLTAFASSIVPFGTFVFDASIRREMAEVALEANGAARKDRVESQPL